MLPEEKRRELAAAKRSLGRGVLSQVVETPIGQLVPYAQNARSHTDLQIETIGRSIEAFGWMNPVLVDGNDVIVAGHGRVEAARRIGLTHVPVLRIEGLTPDQIRAYRLADNRIAEIAGWDSQILAIELQHITTVDIGCSVGTLGWEMPQIDVILDSDVDTGAGGASNDDELPEVPDVAVSRIGDLWLCGDHRVLCGSAVDAAAMVRLMGDSRAQLICQDPPWNQKISSLVGLGRTKHREFVMGSGEMTDAEFSQFLSEELRNNSEHAADGAVVQVFIDWRGVAKVIAAGEAQELELINILVWVKTNGGMSGGPWRSQHELVAVFRKRGAKIKNRVQLGRYGRFRTNVLQAPGLNSFGKGRMEALESHPTRKPVQLVAELMRDVTDIGDAVLDSFLGSGTSLIAAERTRRSCFGMELDPLYVDTAVRRWEQYSGGRAILEGSGKSFADVEIERSQPGAADEPRRAPVRTRTRTDPRAASGGKESAR